VALFATVFSYPPTAEFSLQTGSFFPGAAKILTPATANKNTTNRNY
jgi:hypothetical protein